MSAAALDIRALEVDYGRGPVLAGLNLEVAPGEAVAVLGPSGSGKTTLLYTVAGFTRASAGEIAVDGQVVAGPGTDVPPEQRRVGVVFQHYALWPHLDALDTVAYPFRRAGSSRAEAYERARQLLARLEIADLATRRPAELSGGQQQRIGLARALARAAAVYLFDEPTAHLDAALREAVQQELAERRRELGAAALYATHDFAEALATADRIALLRDGQLVQVGTPAEVYEQPVDVWAARLTGPASILTAQLVHTGGDPALRLGGHLAVPAVRLPTRPAGPVQVLVRPDWVTLGGACPGVVRGVWYRGPHTDHRLETAAGDLDVRMPGPPRVQAGDRVTWTMHRAWIVDTSTVSGR